MKNLVGPFYMTVTHKVSYGFLPGGHLKHISWICGIFHPVKELLTLIKKLCV